MRVYLVNENNQVALSLIKKLDGVRHGQIIPVSAEELKFFKSGNLAILDLPESVMGTTISVAKAAPTTQVPKTTEGPKPLGTSPKSPAA